MSKTIMLFLLVVAVFVAEINSLPVFFDGSYIKPLQSMGLRMDSDDGPFRMIKRRDRLELSDEDFNSGTRCLFNQLSC
ncbi:unnamed protein product [Toxocara canis]|uniref:Neuropeptide-Like Protein n=1 Tax=Toxocara canis TaxID=6265 RepID=A0A183U335_TOXCA|nr:unnamed protein product [Toxocara canis]